MKNSGKKNGNYSNGITILFRKVLEKNSQCKICSATEPLVIHHLDNNHNNNIYSNLIVLCNQCHNNLHQRGYNFRKQKWFIRISEYFTSIQGEGKSQGLPAHFLRLFGCNLNCVFCDSDYAKKDKFQIFSYNETINLLKKWKKTKVNRVVITGGEPFLQNIVPLLILLKLFDFKVEIETNGTLPLYGGNMPPLIKRIYRKELVEQFNISPKLKGSQPYYGKAKGNKLINKNKFNQFRNYNYIVKFVVETEKDFKNAEDVIYRCNITRENVYFMPLTTFDEKKDNEIKKRVWNYCVCYNIRFSPRLHVDMFGKRRGV